MGKWTVKRGGHFRIRLNELTGIYTIEERRWKYLPFWKPVRGCYYTCYEYAMGQHLRLDVHRTMRNKF